MSTLHIVYYSAPGVIEHEETNHYNFKSQALEHVMKYMAVAVANDVEQVVTGALDVYIWRRNGEVLLLEIW
jgi:hypothetical protein